MSCILINQVCSRLYKVYVQSFYNGGRLMIMMKNMPMKKTNMMKVNKEEKDNDEEDDNKETENEERGGGEPCPHDRRLLDVL